MQHGKAHAVGGPLKESSRQYPATKSSPHYQNGNEIDLPEIATDSEDEDSENEFAVPDWASPSHVIDAIVHQDTFMNPEDIFGPMPELRLDEMFRNKDRHARYRARTSSANWSGTDRLTQEDVQNDVEARDLIRRQGGWTYGMTRGDLP